MTESLKSNWTNEDDFYAPDQNEVSQAVNSLVRLDRIANSLSSLPRYLTSGDFSTETGDLFLAYVIAGETFSASSVKTYCGGTAAAGLTKCKFGIYSIDDTGLHTLIGSTGNDTTLFGTTFAAVSKALQVNTSIVTGELYALAFLIAGTTCPNVGGAFVSQSEASAPPRLNGILSAQTDLPETIGMGSVNDSYRIPYLRVM